MIKLQNIKKAHDKPYLCLIMRQNYYIYIWDNTSNQDALEGIKTCFKRLGLHAITEGLQNKALPYSTCHIAVDKQEKALLFRNLLPIIHAFDCMIYFRELNEGEAYPIDFFACDLDGTLIQEELLVRLAKIKDREKEIQEQTSLAILGKESFEENFKNRTLLLKGLAYEEIISVCEGIHFARGSIELLQYFQKKEIPTSLISSNYNSLVEVIARRQNFTYYCSSEEDFDQHKVLNGEIKKLVGAKEKLYFLGELLKKKNISPKHCMVLGDGINDIDILISVGHAVLSSATAQVMTKLSPTRPISPYSWLSILEVQGEKT